ncbi:copper transporter [Nonomuraea salmonea]|uniref:copper transporter n=1 Tax=Nonomuraea salmonea TaxID=46181 RepID=UPI0031E51634
MADGFDAASKGTVLAGIAATTVTPGDVITALRDEGEVSKRVTGVDTADMPLGPVAIVYSLQEQLSGRAGQYGNGKGASGPIPAEAAPPPHPPHHRVRELTCPAGPVACSTRWPAPPSAPWPPASPTPPSPATSPPT